MKTNRWKGTTKLQRKETMSELARFKWFKTSKEDRTNHGKMMNEAKKLKVKSVGGINKIKINK